MIIMTKRVKFNELVLGYRVLDPKTRLNHINIKKFIQRKCIAHKKKVQNEKENSENNKINELFY